MWGYARRHAAPCRGVLDPLQARALVLAADTRRIALVSLDLGRPPTRRSTAAIRGRVRAETGIDHLFLAASHTHHGPVLELDDWPDRQHAYVHTLETKIADLIREAARCLQPARLGVAGREVPRNRNRQSHLPGKPVDRLLQVLRVEDRGGRPIALAVNYAAHPILQDPRDLRFSADYPGALAALVEKETGAPCLFLQGAAGDLSPDPGPHHGPMAFGQALGRAALDLAATISCVPADDFSIRAAEDDFRFGRRVDLSSPEVRLAYNLAFFPALIDFYEREYRDGIRPHLTTALLGGRTGLVGVSGEFFCGHALGLRRRARLEHLLFLGYCNDYQQYFPTIEAAAEGGYGADARMSPVEVGAGEHMIDRALIRLYQMRGRIPNIPASKPEERPRPP